MLRWLRGAVAQWSEHLQLKQAMGAIPSGCSFSSSNVDGINNLWCSSTVWLLSTQTCNFMSKSISFHGYV